LPNLRRWSLLVVVLIGFTSCSTGTENDSVIEDTSTPTPRARVRPDTSASSEVARPRPGAYVYELAGIGGTEVPDGTQLTQTIAASGDVDFITVTTNRNDNTQRLELRWESKRVVQLSNQTTIGGQQRTCVYDPPLEVLHIPMFIEPFDDQTFRGAACESKVEIEVVDRDSVKDATGRAWSVWVIETRSEASGRSDMTTHWFSPELGRDIRTQTTTETTDRQDQTEQILSRYPGLR
jgi:hypothetical protein